MKKILVIGDVMIDRYTFGEVSRISPEAPVPIVKATREEYRLGGAANVAANVASVGHPVHLACIPSRANHVPMLVDLCRGFGMTVSHDLRKVDRLPMKQRIIAQSQQMLRIDDEQMMPPIVDEDVEQHLDGVGALIISDYGKGSVGDCSALIGQCISRGIAVFVDPKGPGWERYKGATVITPNEAEAAEQFGKWETERDLTLAASSRMRTLLCDDMLVTRGSRGISLISQQAERIDIPATAREVFDVTGAGDTVIAITAVAWLRGCDIEDAARVANAAAGIVVGRLGASQISADEFASICRGI